MSLADELEAQARAAAREAELLLARARKVREEESRNLEPAPSAAPTLYTVPDFAARHAFLTESMVRHHLFHRLTNGLVASGAVAKLGARILIDEPKFLEWLRANGQNEIRKPRKSKAA